MPSQSVKPAGKRHSHGGYVGGADATDGPVACHGCAGQRQGASGWACRLRRRSKRQVRWALPGPDIDEAEVNWVLDYYRLRNLLL
jgi:hypothetical protein